MVSFEMRGAVLSPGHTTPSGSTVPGADVAKKREIVSFDLVLCD